MLTATQEKKEISLKNKTKILLVDDNEIIRIYFRDIFWIHGLENKYDLSVVESVEKAEKLIENPETRPEVVFCGLVMPLKQGDKTVVTPLAGFSLLEKIKSDPELKKIKVIIFSGHNEKRYRDRARKLGANSFLVKHKNMPRELVEFIENLNEK